MNSKTLCNYYYMYRKKKSSKNIFGNDEIKEYKAQIL